MGDHHAEILFSLRNNKLPNFLSENLKETTQMIPKKVYLVNNYYNQDFYEIVFIKDMLKVLW